MKKITEMTEQYKKDLKIKLAGLGLFLLVGSAFIQGLTMLIAAVEAFGVEWFDFVFCTIWVIITVPIEVFSVVYVMRQKEDDDKGCDTLPCCCHDNKWILCSEDLPPIQTKEEIRNVAKQYIVDVLYEGSEDHLITMMAYGVLDDEEEPGWINTDEYYLIEDSGYKVLAWQNLPEPMERS